MTNRVIFNQLYYVCDACASVRVVMFVVLPMHGMVARRNWLTAFFLSEFMNPNNLQTADLNAAGAFHISVSTDTTPMTTTLFVAMFAKGIRYVEPKLVRHMNRKKTTNSIKILA